MKTKPKTQDHATQITALHDLAFALNVEQRLKHKPALDELQQYFGDTTNLDIGGWERRRGLKRFRVAIRGQGEGYYTLEEAAKICQKSLGSFRCSISNGNGRLHCTVGNQLITVVRVPVGFNKAPPINYLRD